MRLALMALHAIIGVSAIAAGYGLAARPGGEALGFETGWLEGSPFDDYRIPGLFLALVIGPTNLVSLAGQWRKAAWAPAASLGSGLILVAWIIIQTAIIGYRHWSQLLWMVLFALETTLSALQTSRRSPGGRWKHRVRQAPESER